MIVYCSALIAIGMIDLKNSFDFPRDSFFRWLWLRWLLISLFRIVQPATDLLFGPDVGSLGLYFLLLAFFLSKLILKKEGMGLGDVYMAAMMGFMVGFPKNPLSRFSAELSSGGGTAIFLVISKKKSKKDTIPFWRVF